MVKKQNYLWVAPLVLIANLQFSQESPAADATLDITTPPSKAEWQHFNKMNPAQLTKLWNHHVDRGSKNLGSWAWQWRLGWVRQCGQPVMPKLCTTILRQGLNDDAMVVRAESATALGALYRGKPNEEIAKSLAAAFVDPRNVRNGSPLFVCDRILAALKNMGGIRAEKIATNLANKFPQTASYWAKMQRQAL